MLYFEVVIFSSVPNRIGDGLSFFLTKYDGKRTIQNAIKLSLQCILHQISDKSLFLEKIYLL